MTMKAFIRTDVYGNFHLLLRGGLTFDNGIPMREELLSLINKRPASTITIDFQHVDFVGSSGINIFVETLKLLNRDRLKVFIKNIGPEFIKVFKLYQLDNIDSLLVQEENEVQELTPPTFDPTDKAA